MPFALLDQINEELRRLEKKGLLSKVEYSEWASPTIYVNKKSKEILVCGDFSTGLTDALKDYHYDLPSPEEISVSLNCGIFFLKLELSDAYLQKTGD